jgi:hypothetical protein
MGISIKLEPAMGVKGICGCMEGIKVSLMFVFPESFVVLPPVFKVWLPLLAPALDLPPDALDVPPVADDLPPVALPPAPPAPPVAESALDSVPPATLIALVLFPVVALDVDAPVEFVLDDLFVPLAED